MNMRLRHWIVTLLLVCGVSACGDAQLSAPEGRGLIAPGATVGKFCRNLEGTSVSRQTEMARAKASKQLTARIRLARAKLVKLGARKIRVFIDPVRCAQAIPPTDRLFGTSCTARAQVCPAKRR